MLEAAPTNRTATSGIRAASIALAILSISLFHHILPLADLHGHVVFQHLYYLPIVIAALSFGWRGGLTAAVLAGISHAPYIYLTWRVDPDATVDQILEIPLFCVAGVLAGILSERERTQRAHLERTTAQLAAVYRELRDSFERMKRVERLSAVGQLSAGLAHEIRNPLASIAGAVGIIERDSGSESKRSECLSIIKRETERLNRLLSSFLDFARPRPPQYQTIDLSGTLDSVIALAAHAVDRKPIILRKEAPANLPALECDPEQLKQVLLNLLINAIQASPNGSDVIVTARHERSKVFIQVKDGGCGIAPENREKIFDPFFTTKESGTGLGLSVAHQIIEQHGGILTAEANPDRGMTFSVVLPLRRERF
jgi:two-component system sensor histidine kinase HydH